MTEKHLSSKPDEKKAFIRKAKSETNAHEAQPPGSESAAMATLQQQVGNRAVQRLIAQRAGAGAFDLDDDTAGRINSQRGGGQALDAGVQAKMGAATGHDFSGVKVHTDGEAHTLNEQLGARAFTTGQDIFFRSGEYSPGSSGGQELLAHELTHVVQQGTGRVSGGGGKMTVNAPDDSFEQEADSVAQSVSTGPTAGIQRQEEEELQTKRLQRQEEEEEVQMQPEEEEVQTMRLQRQEEEEEVQMQPEEEEVQAMRLQRQEEEVQMQPEEEEEVQAMRLQRQEEPEEEEMA
jgi:hypothetical protein